MSTPEAPPGGSPAPYGGQLEREELMDATVSGARWVGVSRVIAEILALATTVTLARLVSPGEYGVAVVVLILPMLASILTYEGFGAFLFQTRDCTPERVGSAVVMSVSAGLLLTVLVFALAPLVAEPIFGHGTAHLAQLSAPIFLVFSFAAVPRALLMRRLDWKWLNLSDMVQLVVVSAVSLTLAALGLGSEALILGALAGGIAVTAVLVAAAPRSRPRWDGASGWAIVKFGGPAALAGLTATLQRNVTFLVLAGSTSPAQVGLYWRAYQLGVEYQYKVTHITYRVATPVLTRAAKLKDLREIRTRLVRLNATLIYPLLALLIVLAPDLVPFVFGHEWSHAVAPTQILAIAGLAAIMLAGIDAPLIAVGRPGALAIFNLVLMLGTATVAAVLASSGIVAVAIGTAVWSLTMLVAAQFFLLHRLIGVPMRESFGEGAAALACSAILVLATLPLVDMLRPALGPIPLTLLTSAVGLGIYALCLRTVSPSAWADLRTLFMRVLGGRRLLALRGSLQRA